MLRQPFYRFSSSAIGQIRDSTLEADLAVKKTLVRCISHEFRTPLSIAIIGLDLLEDQIKGGASMSALLDMVRDVLQWALTSCLIRA
jgi:signal transduction histidine kinase